MSRGTVSTACSAFQNTLRHVWASGSTYAEMTSFLGVSRDQIIRLRDRLPLPLRLDRRLRKKGPRHADPTPAEIRQRCAELRAEHIRRRMAEPRDKTYQRSESDYVRFRLESYEVRDDALEQLLDNFGDE